MVFTNVDVGLFVGGLIAGFAFQRSRLCFVSAFRDLYLFRAVGMTRAILVLTTLATVAGAVIVLERHDRGLPMLELVGPSPLAAAVGGVVFGFGMILAGSCPSGACWRFAEGQLSQLPILSGVLAGTWLYVVIPLFDQEETLTPVPWWLPAIFTTLALLAVVWWDRRHSGPGEELPLARPKGVRSPWPPELGAALIVLALSTFAFLFSKTWTVTRAFLLTDLHSLLFVGGLFAGGFVGARFGREWRVRPMGSRSDRRLRFIGGLFMGFGARVGAGCTVGLYLSGLVTLSPLPWYWLGGAVIGTAGGAVALYRYISR